MGPCIQWMGFLLIIVAPKPSHQVSSSAKSDRCELREVSQNTVVAEDLRTLLSAGFSIRIMERGKISKEKDEGKN